MHNILMIGENFAILYKKKESQFFDNWFNYCWSSIIFHKKYSWNWSIFLIQNIICQIGNY